MICKNCSKQIADDSLFCNFCGSKVEKELKCSSCGTVLPEGSAFCNKCGTRVGGNAAAQTPPASASQQTQQVNQTADTGFSEECIAFRSDLHMLSQNNRDVKFIPYVSDYNLGYYNGYIYRSEYDDIGKTYKVYKINQKTAQAERIFNLDENYGIVYGVNRCGLFFIDSQDEKNNIHYTTVTNIDFDGTIHGQAELEQEGSDDEGYDLFYNKWTIIIDDNLYCATGFSVKHINIRSGITKTIFEFADNKERDVFCIDRVTANLDSVFFSIHLSEDYKEKYEFDPIWNNHTPYWRNSEYWYRYNLKSGDIQCLSSSKRDIRNILKSPGSFCKFYDSEPFDEEIDNPDYIDDPNFQNIKVIDVVKGIMWTLEEGNCLVARKIGQNQPIISTMPKWKIVDSYSYNRIYFDGERYLRGDRGCVIKYSCDGSETRIEKSRYGNSESMIAVGDYLYAEFDSAYTGKIERINIHECEKIEPAPELAKNPDSV